MIMKGKRTTMHKESFMQGVLFLMVSQFFVKILGLLYKLYLTNKEGFGDIGNAIYGSGFQIYALLLTISSVGVPNAISKLISEKIAIGDNRGANRIFKVAFLTFGLIGILGTIILYIGSTYISEVWLQIPESKLTLIALAPSIFFVSISSVMRGYYNGKNNMKITAKSQIIEQLFKSILTLSLVEVLFIISNSNTEIMAAGANLATTIATILSFIYLYTFYKINRKIIGMEILQSVNYKRERIRTIIKKILLVSMPMTLSSIMVSLNKNIDSITTIRGLRHFMSLQSAKAQYGILSGKVDILTTLPLSFNIAFATALVPAISSEKAKGDIYTIKKRISFSLLITILLGLPCTVGMILFANPILNLLFPNATEGALILQISACSIIFISIEQTINGALQGIGKVMIPAISLGIGVAVKLILNLILIPIENIGINGAAIGTVICHIIAFFIAYTSLKKEIDLNLKVNKFIIKPIIATFIMGICSIYLYIKLKSIIVRKMATIISIIFAILIYIINLIILKIFSKEEIYMIPYGKKLYEILEKLDIYTKKRNFKKKF